MDKPIRDYVLPLIEAKQKGGSYEYLKFHGTCFLLGDEGFALTNAHLLGVDDGNVLCALTTGKNGKWEAHEIASNEQHGSHDIALLHIPSVKRESIFEISSVHEQASRHYMQWCYPEEVVQELFEAGQVIPRPDLVYLEGYVRRRLSDFTIPGTQRGDAYYEVSEPGTVGCSGSPIIKIARSEKWSVIGVFACNRVSTNNGTSVAFAVRSDVISGWTPGLLTGRKLSEL